jgi:hypothetical protein
MTDPAACRTVVQRDGTVIIRLLLKKPRVARLTRQNAASSNFVAVPPGRPDEQGERLTNPGGPQFQKPPELKLV